MSDYSFDPDQHVKEMKESIVPDATCTCCGGEVSEWDMSTRDGICANCFWGRCSKGTDCEAQQVKPWKEEF
jgi:hypothetical protein